MTVSRAFAIWIVVAPLVSMYFTVYTDQSLTLLDTFESATLGFTAFFLSTFNALNLAALLRLCIHFRGASPKRMARNTLLLHYTSDAALASLIFVFVGRALNILQEKSTNFQTFYINGSHLLYPILPLYNVCLIPIAILTTVVA